MSSQIADIELIVVSTPGHIENEASAINQLFEAGLKRFHLRKPTWDQGLKQSLLGKIESSYHEMISVHVKSQNDKWFGWNGSWHGPGEQSCSVHSWEEYIKLPEHADYCFIGPVFDSISKPGYLANPSLMMVPQKTSTDLIAIGGVNKQNQKELRGKGYDGVALLGAIWQGDPIANYSSFSIQMSMAQ